MDDYRSKSFAGGGGGRMEIQPYYGGGGQSNRASSYGGPQDLRCYSASYAASSSMPQTYQPQTEAKQVKLKKGKSTGGGSSSRIWNFNDPEVQRKKRVASYKVYSVEGKLKGTLRNNFRWLKHKYTQVVYGWW